VGSDGLAADSTNRQYVRLDVGRQWLLTRALLTDPSIDLLWMFVSRDVEALLIQHARAMKEPSDLVWRAEQVLHQPRDSAPHDDHVHVRVACLEAEMLEGCAGGGPRWPWFAPIFQDEVLTPISLSRIANDEPVVSDLDWSTDGKESNLR
jgi:penicillin-insensitive murein endopeptidase